VSKVVPIAPAMPSDAVRRAKLDEYGEITRRLALCEPDEERAAVLKAEIQSWHESAPADEPIVDRGERWEIQMSPRRNERSITDKRKAFNLLKKSLGLDGVIAVIDIGLGVLDKHIPKSAQKAFVTEERSGCRTLKPVAIHPVADLPRAA
jgi:hypothetical protein